MLLFKIKEAVAVFSLEMSAEQLITRSIAAMGGINSDQLRSGKLLKPILINTMQQLNVYHSVIYILMIHRGLRLMK